MENNMLFNIAKNNLDRNNVSNNYSVNLDERESETPSCTTAYCSKYDENGKLYSLEVTLPYTQEDKNNGMVWVEGYKAVHSFSSQDEISSVLVNKKLQSDFMTIAKLEKDKHLQNKFYGQNDFEYEVGKITEDTSREQQGFFFCRDLARAIGFIDSQDNKNLVKSSYIFSPLVCFKVKALVNKHRYYSYDSNSFQASKIILEQMLPFYKMYEKAYNYFKVIKFNFPNFCCRYNLNYLDFRKHRLNQALLVTVEDEISSRTQETIRDFFQSYYTRNFADFIMNECDVRLAYILTRENIDYNTKVSLITMSKINNPITDKKIINEVEITDGGEIFIRHGSEAKVKFGMLKSNDCQ